MKSSLSRYTTPAKRDKIPQKTTVSVYCWVVYSSIESWYKSY